MHAAGIFSLRDLLYVVPYQYRDVNHCCSVADARPGERAAFHLQRLEAPKLSRFGKISKVTCTFEDGTGVMTAVWFNQPWMKENLQKQTRYLLYGLVEQSGAKCRLSNPSVEDAERIVPLYRPLEGLPQKVHEKLVKQALPQVEALCPEWLSSRVLEERHLMPCAEAIAILHAPKNMDEVKAARRRLVFEQMLLYQTAARMLRQQRKRGISMGMEAGVQKAFWESLPFAPTAAQQRTLAEIVADMAGEIAMARMVQGDVGCGKTAIAMGAILFCVQGGYQAAMMVPTEVLARQHYEDLKPYFENKGISCGLLIGGLPAKERREALVQLKTGGWQVVIGTHALISKGVEYEKLGLCITDEQHRFGVGQRTALMQKGKQCVGGETLFPHLLVMSATPIPRSLALVLFGDLEVSIVDELPPGRLPVSTRIVPQAKRQRMYGFMRKALEAGEQAYIVCPLVEDSEAMDGTKAVETHFRELQQGALQGISMGFTHGKQSSAEKEQVIHDFAEGKLQVLVATTVIEVGVNVPMATIMVIEDADHYGLAQLHQLRGRVGRGSRQSWCFLLSKENERLRALVETNDGFEIARKDLELRGPGEILGTAQHGTAERLGGMPLLGDMTLLYEAAECVESLEKDPSRGEEWIQLQKRAKAYLEKVSETVSVS